MPTFLLNKIVRDKLPKMMTALGQTVTIRELSDAELAQALTAKIVEEANELHAEKKDIQNELADLLEITYATGKALGYSPADLDALRIERNQKRGGFDNNAFITKLEVPEGDKWADYYRSNPLRFPEADK